ncbi:MAG: 2,3-bisphosphoglycerate-dependent phosphoglycerate mutase [Alphaproteobacteria bacterium]|nr:2,3-bisphosphoglycerate-dependent phosphoglycerate mutase [Alphaproteobacteria bacterium]
MTDRLLVLVRHGQSEWNLSNRFTGSSDVDLTGLGVEQARHAGRTLRARGIRFDVGFTSALKRAWRSLDLILDEMDQSSIPVIRSPALDERDYGDLTGLDKNDARATWGEAQVETWRRSYDVPPPGGESLKDTAARVLALYDRDILPRVLRGECVVVAGHEHSLRALVMVLERLNTTQIAARELATGIPVIYRLGADAAVAERLDPAG